MVIAETSQLAVRQVPYLAKPRARYFLPGWRNLSPRPHEGARMSPAPSAFVDDLIRGRNLIVDNNPDVGKCVLEDLHESRETIRAAKALTERDKLNQRIVSGQRAGTGNVPCVETTINVACECSGIDHLSPPPVNVFLCRLPASAAKDSLAHRWPQSNWPTTRGAADWTKATTTAPSSTTTGNPAQAGPGHAYDNRGVVYGNKGDYDRAVADFDKAIQLKPNLGTAYYNRAVAYDRQGELAQALRDYRAAARVIPASEPWERSGARPHC